MRLIHKVKFLQLILVLAAFTGFSQSASFSLQKGQCLSYRNNLYIFGFKDKGFKVFKLTEGFKILDSNYIETGKSGLDFLQIDYDTIHGSMNYILQNRNNSKVTLLRLNDSLRLINQYTDLDITKLNPLSSFQVERFPCGDNYYVVKSVQDTSGTQYYLSKFHFSSDAKSPFNYQFQWQFNFEKKHISQIHILMADSNQVLVYVGIGEGPKKGEWLLKVNARNGLLTKAHKINRNPALIYQYSNFVYEGESKSLLLMGQISSTAMITSPTPTLYIEGYDSLLNNILSFTLPVSILDNNAKAVGKSNFLLQVTSITKKYGTNYQFIVDAYIEQNNEYKYILSSICKFTYTEDLFECDPIIMKRNPLLEGLYTGMEKGDLSGKLLSDSTFTNRSLFYKKPVVPLKLYYFEDEEQPVWITRKENHKDTKITIQKIAPGVKNYEIKTIKEFPKSTEVTEIEINGKVFTCQQKDEDHLIIDDVFSGH